LSEDGSGPGARDERLRALVEAVPLALFEAGPDGSWTFGNAKFRELLGLPEGERLEAGITRIIDPGDRDRVIEAWRKATAAGEPFRAEFRSAAGPGPSRWIRARAVAVRGADGAFRGYAGVLEDVTEDRARERLALEEAERERERSRRKSEFLAVMSHELRTPIHGVVGTAGLLQGTNLTPEQREYADMLAQSADATLSVINNVLDLSKIEAGRLELDPSDFDLREVVEKAVSMFAARAHAKGIDLACRIAGGVPSALRGDPERLRQVLVNLLSNAVKFTEKGEVVLVVSRVDERKGGPDLLRFEVQDSGMGVPESERERLFEPFAQADPSISARFGGTGLGLTICRQLLRLMHGVIGVEGRPGRGSTFWFTAQFEPPGRPPPPSAAVPEDVRGRRVLIVDDHEASREAIADLLRGWDALVLEAASAEEALGTLLKGASESEYVDIVILDMHLPGDATARKFVDAVRANADLERVRVILTTSFGHRARAEAAHWEGIAAFLAKPVRKADLLECLVAATSEEEAGQPFGRAARPRAPAVSPSGSFRIARILVVDDNEVNRKIAVRQLGQKGFLVDTAVNGREAVDAVARTPYDLVFMDWMMPEMDGFEATRKIREMEKGKGFRVPIVAMTARAMEGDRERCLEPGMDDYLTKPVRFEDLDAVLERWLAPLISHGPQPMPAPAQSAAITAPIPAAARPGEPASVDPAALDALAALQGPEDGDIVAELVEIFHRETAPRLDRLDAAVRGEDSEVLMREAHGLKGTAASIGANRLSQIAKSMEDGGRAGSTLGADRLLRDLREEYGRVTVALRERMDRSRAVR
jgi:PAS domain S-box-containing protein